jgi:hypothetical protein
MAIAQEEQESERYPGLFFFVSFFSSFLFNIQDVIAKKSSRHGRDESRQESPKVLNRERQPHNQLRLFMGYGLQ